MGQDSKFFLKEVRETFRTEASRYCVNAYCSLNTRRQYIVQLPSVLRLKLRVRGNEGFSALSWLYKLRLTFKRITAI